MRLLFVLAIATSCGLRTLHAQAVSAAQAAKPTISCSNPAFPGHEWKQASQENQKGWSKPALDAAQAYADSLHDSSVVIVQCGHLIDQWGDTNKRITTFSVRKSLISALFGIYATEGKIDINETLEQAGIDDTPMPLTKEER